jgi:hypothetical protein
VSIRRACGASIAAALTLLLLVVPAASATFHEMMVREVYPGSAAHPGSEYVELQMWSPGQNLVGGHQISVFDATGAPAGTATFPHEVSGDATQSTLVAATPEAEAEFGFGADAVLPSGSLSPSGGAVCWESLDCVAWGNFSGSTKSSVGSPAAPAGIPDGMALRRTIEPGCATLLEPSDDHDNSAVDFAPAFPAPRPNSVGPSEHACASQTAGGGSASPQGSPGETRGKRPQTQLGRLPGHLTRDRTPTFRFASSTPGSTYLCKLDRGDFKRCASPFTAPRLDFGHHLFKVRASAPNGALDRSPATYSFKIVKPRRGLGRHSP